VAKDEAKAHKTDRRRSVKQKEKRRENKERRGQVEVCFLRDGCLAMKRVTLSESLGVSGRRSNRVESKRIRRM
jgi:hypothetical protein